MSDILIGLNPAQRAAVENYQKPSLIIAGAGSGKTRVLTARIAFMIEHGVAPHSILALTFTKKAAEQMRERISSMVSESDARYITMGTFHSIFSRILRQNSEAIGFPQSFTIYETTDSRNLIKAIIKEMNLGDDKYKPNSIHARISYAKNALVTPEAYAANVELVNEDRRSRIPEFGAIYSAYCARCKRNGAMDFDDLLLQTNILFRDHPQILAQYQEVFQYILVDEYQDTNYAQYVIIKRLAEKHRRVSVVGDDAQSIYSFRGAKIENILNFKRDYPEALTFKLEQNYRSTRVIVEAANSLIAHNSNRMDKHCFSQGDMGEPITLFREYTEALEAERVTSSIMERVSRQGADFSQIAILYRNNNQSQALEKALRARGIQYKIYKGNSFFDHKEVKDFIAYIRLIINPKDDEALKRIINTPARGIGATTIERIASYAEQNSISMWEAIEVLTSTPQSDSVQRTIAKKVSDFVALITSLSAERYTKSLYDYGHSVATGSGLIGFYTLQNSPEGQSAVNNIEEILNTMQTFNEERESQIRSGILSEDEVATIEEWLESVMLSSDMDNKEQSEDEGKVTLMTVHSSKGLEYDYIYIVGVEDNLFPSMMAIESGNIEEERRLFYVAITRAKIAACISFSETRFKWGNMEFTRPSQFLREIDAKYLDIAAGVELTARRAPSPSGGGRGDREAVEELRRRYDVRNRQRFQQNTTTQQRPNRDIIEPKRPSLDGMRSLGAQRIGSTPSTAPQGGAGCSYSVGDRVEHPRFGRGEVVRIEMLATDHKVVVNFSDGGEKTLLAKFAKLTKTN
ncbi:MAG: UvrD-helicase domain-containing protein [Rikenellaceae bacterium]